MKYKGLQIDRLNTCLLRPEWWKQEGKEHPTQSGSKFSPFGQKLYDSLWLLCNCAFAWVAMYASSSATPRAVEQSCKKGKKLVMVVIAPVLSNPPPSFRGLCARVCVYVSAIILEQRQKKRSVWRGCNMLITSEVITAGWSRAPASPKLWSLCKASVLGVSIEYITEWITSGYMSKHSTTMFSSWHLHIFASLKAQKIRKTLQSITCIYLNTCTAPWRV